LLQIGVERRGEGERQHAPRLGRQDDAVVPEPRRGEIGAEATAVTSLAPSLAMPRVSTSRPTMKPVMS
jgi:hypothetical protein